MTPHTQPRPNLVPTSSPTRDDPTDVTSSLVPHPSGGRGHSGPSKPHTPHTPPARPRDEVTWTPDHPSTSAAWSAVVDNLTDRGNRGLWSSPTIAAAIAHKAGDLTNKRAADLIRSAIKHAYLEERLSPLGCSTQIRLPVDGGR